MKSFIVFIGFVVGVVIARQGFGPTDQEWGFVTVRSSAHIFWWLHYTRAGVSNFTERPLVIYVQGGPGSSSTGFGNFAELGPLDTDLNPRNISWDRDVNVLFVDSPVGTGFSYVEDDSALVTTNKQIADDFVVFFKAFLDQNPLFKKVPLYLFSESYGGKMTVEITVQLLNEIKNGNIECQLKGIALGDPWISPIDSVLTWATYLLNLGIVDQNGYDKISESVNVTKVAIDAGKFGEAFSLWQRAEYKMALATYGVDFYNVLKKERGKITTKENEEYVYGPAVDPDADKKIEVIMNGVVRQALNISQMWGGQRRAVFAALNEDFMRPVVNLVEKLLNSTDILVAVYNGQLDLLVDSLGSVKWINEMHWHDKDLWKRAGRSRYISHGYYEGYVKKAGKLSFYWVDRAGHMVSADNPTGMHYVLKDVTNNFCV